MALTLGASSTEMLAIERRRAPWSSARNGWWPADLTRERAAASTDGSPAGNFRSRPWARRAALWAHVSRRIGRMDPAARQPEARELASVTGPGLRLKA